MRILAIGAHLDDIELACGGTLARAMKGGHSVKMVIMSKSGYSNYDGKLMRTDSVALTEGYQAASALGVSDIEILDFENKNIQYHYSVIEALDEIIDRYSPDIIFTHYVFDTHQSHEGVAKSSLSAARRRNTIYMYEPIVPAGRSYVAFKPQLYVDISTTIDDKLSSLRAHKTELVKYGDSWIEGVLARARFRGYEMGVKYAEAFEVIRCTLDLGDE